jgi:hypothetical protein
MSTRVCDVSFPPIPAISGVAAFDQSGHCSAAAQGALTATASKDLALTLIEEMSVRRISACLAALLLSGCSGGGTDETNKMMPPPSEIEAPNSNVETKAERDQRLREKAKTDPDGADAEAIDNMSRNEVLATAINTAGFLCARVTSVYPVGGNINVECVEYRNGIGRARYLIDPNSGTVEQR